MLHFKCSTNCGDGRRYREVYCKDDHTSIRLSGHMCNKNDMPNTEEMCRRMSCNIINNEVEPENDLGAIQTYKSDMSHKKVNVNTF